MAMNWLKNVAVSYILLSLTFALCGCRKTDRSDNKSSELIIFHAGSRACARKISDLKKQCDIIASADYRVIDSLLIPEYADFNIKFALNEMVIAYTANSKYSDTVRNDNWHEILLKDDVAIRRSEPDLDPCGYRTILVFQLAEKYFKQPGLAKKLKAKNRYIRPKETDLLGLLKAGEIDYMFIYRSVAAQHGLKFIELGDKLNLGSEKFDDLYKTSTVTLSGKKPGETITRAGESMVYSVTIPKNAPNRETAEAWVSFLLSPQGQEIMNNNGQPSVNPAITDDYNKLPESLRKWAKPQKES